MLPSIDTMRSLLEYRDGVLYWKERAPSSFTDGVYSAARNCKIWNTLRAGKPALQCKNGRGYRKGSVLGVNMNHHKAVWAVCHGVWPEHEIDHIDGDSSNDRIENLRDVSSSENSRNRKRPSHNKSGVIGVSFRTATGKWRAAIKIAGKCKDLGNFVSKEDAISARRAAEKSYGFHQNHGRAA